jgi:N-acetylneuraminate synthase
MSPAEMAQLFVETEWAWQAVGKVNYCSTKSLQYRRSFYVAQNLKAGDILTKENVRAILPGSGLRTKGLDVVSDRIVSKDVNRGTSVNWAMFE